MSFAFDKFSLVIFLATVVVCGGIILADYIRRSRLKRFFTQQWSYFVMSDFDTEPVSWWLYLPKEKVIVCVRKIEAAEQLKKEEAADILCRTNQGGIEEWYI